MNENCERLKLAVQSIPAEGELRLKYAAEINDLVERRTKHMDGEYEADMERLADFAERQFQQIRAKDRALSIIWKLGAQALAAIKHEIEEILDLYKEPSQIKNNVHSFPSSGGGNRILRSSKSFS